jgi:hypothetical protein
VEREPEGRYVIFSEPPRNSEDPTLIRCDESDVGSSFASMSDALWGLGQMFGIKPYWADEAVDPYFPTRRP